MTLRLTAVAAGALAGTVLIVSPALAAQNGNPFYDAALGKVDYRATPFKSVVDCASMAEEAAEGVTIQSARLIPANAGVPEYCKIDGVIAPEVGFRLSLPSHWNGRLYMYGNGGYAGEPADGPRELSAQETGLKNGFATVRTDTGHLASKDPKASFASNPGKLIDHAYLAVHQTIQYAKVSVARFYGRGASHSYWQGCSTGGREGVMSAQRYPDDFDGIAAAAPTLRWNDIMVKGLWQRKVLAGVGMTPAKLTTVFAAVMRKCDGLDGAVDGLIADPLACKFDPTRDVTPCQAGADKDDCLTQAQAAAMQKIYSGPLDAAGRPIFVAQVPGAESLETADPFLMARDGSAGSLEWMADAWMQYFVFANSNAVAANFDFTHDPAKGDAVSEVMNPKPDLDAFHARGGKMITYWGWSDTALNPLMGVRFYQTLAKRHGLQDLQGFYRLFLIPGVAHCTGGYGPSTIDSLTPVIDWVEAGVVPERLLAHSAPGAEVVRKRAYCPYPARTVYRGGDTEDPTNYSCKSPAS